MVKGGFFSSDYMAYVIQTKPIGYNVERRFTDFVWLRTILEREYPGFYVDYFLLDSSHLQEK